MTLLLFSHAHADHFNATMAGTFLQRHPETWMVGNALVVDEMAAQSKDVFNTVRDRVARVEPEWGKPVVQRVGDVTIKVLPLNEDIPERPSKTCAFLFEIGGLKVLHVGDNNAASNVDAFRGFGLDREAIDIAFVDPSLLGSAAGRTIVSQYIKPRAIILMHMRSDDVERFVRELGPTTPNLLAFREPMEKQFFGR